MGKIVELTPHVANLIAAGEVVERPASAGKELVENAVDAGATKITVEIRDGGMTFLRVTDNGCGMQPEDAVTAFKRHATSKLRTEEDLAAISTMGFRGEALAAIASVSRIDLLTKTPGALFGTSLHLEAGVVTEQEEAGCPEGTTILVRNLFYNTPARMKFMKSDTVEGGRVAAMVQQQALAHPEIAFSLIRDGRQVLNTPGNGDLEAAVYSVYGRECADMVKVESRWDAYGLRGYVSKPTDARPSRNLQTFFVNHRPVKSKLLIAALEEAYRNQIMVGKFPACVLHLTLPVNAVDVNVHPAKTEVKFLSERNVFDCVQYGVLGALNQTKDRPAVKLPDPAPGMSEKPPQTSTQNASVRKEPFFRTMTAEAYRNMASVVQNGPKPRPENAGILAEQVKKAAPEVRQEVILPSVREQKAVSPAPVKAQEPPRAPSVPERESLREQLEIPMPKVLPWRLVGELYKSYLLVEQGEDAFLIDKHAAHERILFEKLKANQERISSQILLSPMPCTMSPEAAAELLANASLLEELGFAVEEFGQNTLLLRQIPMDLSPADAAEALESLAADLLSGRRERKDTVRDEMLHTVACKAAIKAGWDSDPKELMVLAEQVMTREDLKYCPHGRPICISLSKKQLEKQFKRS